MFDVLAIGAANSDFYFHVKNLPVPDEEVEAISIDKKLGGSAANFIVGCAKLNLKTRFLGCVGLDSEGNELMHEFNESNVDTSLVQRIKARTGRVVIIVNDLGEKEMAAFVGANNLLSKQMVTEEAIISAKLVHITSLSSDSAFKACVRAKNLAKENNVLVSLDPGHILAERGVDKLRDLLDGVDFFFPSRGGLKKLTGLDNVEESCKSLAGLIKTIVVTLGSEGCFVYFNGKGFVVKPVKARILDTTGAGDAFAAAFVYGVIKGKALPDCAAIANRAAGISLSGKGARPGQVSEKVLLGTP